MERPLNPVAIPAPDLESHVWANPWVRLLPLWRHAAWLALFFGVCAASVSVRVDVRDLQLDLARHARLQGEAELLRERLQLELSVRRNTAAIESVAADMGLSGEAPVVLVELVP